MSAGPAAGAILAGRGQGGWSWPQPIPPAGQARRGGGSRQRRCSQSPCSCGHRHSTAAGEIWLACTPFSALSVLLIAMLAVIQGLGRPFAGLVSIRAAAISRHAGGLAPESRHTVPAPLPAAPRGLVDDSLGKPDPGR